MSLGSELSRIRIAKGLRQKDLAAQLEVRQSNLARWENNLARPRPQTLQRLADALDVSVEALLASEHGQHSGQGLQEVDSELANLLRQVHRLEPRDREGLKIVLQSMLTKAQMHEVLSKTVPEQKAARAS